MLHRSFLYPKDGVEEKAANPHTDYQVVANKKRGHNNASKIWNGSQIRYNFAAKQNYSPTINPTDK